MAASASTSVLGRIVEPVVRSLNADAAQALLRIRADRVAAKRMTLLAQKCNEGELTTEEHTEYEANVLAAELLALLQAEARAMLAQRNGR